MVCRARKTLPCQRNHLRLPTGLPDKGIVEWVVLLISGRGAAHRGPACDGG